MREISAKRTYDLDSNGGVYFLEHKKIRAGDQTKIFDGKFLVEGEKCTHDPSPAAKNVVFDAGSKC